MKLFKKKKDDKSKVLTTIITIVVLVVTVGAISYGMMEPKVHFSDDSFRVSGLYGVSVSSDEIEYVELRNEIPKATSRVNGLDFFSVQKGHYRLEEFDRGRLFVHNPHISCVLVKLHDNTVIIIALDSDGRSQEIYQGIKDIIE